MTVPPRISRTAGTPKCVLTSTSSSSSEGESSNAGDEVGACGDASDGRGPEVLSKPLIEVEGKSAEVEGESSKETPVGVVWDSLHPDMEASAGEECGSQGVEGPGAQVDGASSLSSHEVEGSGASGVQGVEGSGVEGPGAPGTEDSGGLDPGASGAPGADGSEPQGVAGSGLQGAEVSGVHPESS